MDLMGAPSDRIAQQAVDRSVAASQAERGFSSTKNDGTTSQPTVQAAAIAGSDNAHQAEPQPAHSTSATGPRLFHAIIPHDARLHDAGRTGKLHPRSSGRIGRAMSTAEQIGRSRPLV